MKHLLWFLGGIALGAGIIKFLSLGYLIGLILILGIIIPVVDSVTNE